MNWIETTSSFRYNGSPVTRTKNVCHTPIGAFVVAEAVSGKIFIRGPLIKKSNLGLEGYDPDPDNEFSPGPRIQVTSIEEGKKAQEILWNRFKEEVNKI